MYGDVVMGVQKKPGEDHEPFETVIENLKAELFPGQQHVEDTKIDAKGLQTLVQRFKALVKERTGKDFPTDPWVQLEGAIGAVFGSWMNDRAIVYRAKYNIPTEWGTAVNVQSMVLRQYRRQIRLRRRFHPRSRFRRKSVLRRIPHERPGRGRRGRRPHAQAGGRTGQDHARSRRRIGPRSARPWKSHFRDVQDFEFTIEDGKVFMLQTRNGKRTGLAAVRFAVEMERRN